MKCNRNPISNRLVEADAMFGAIGMSDDYYNRLKRRTNNNEPFRFDCANYWHKRVMLEFKIWINETYNTRKYTQKHVLAYLKHRASELIPDQLKLKAQYKEDDKYDEFAELKQLKWHFIVGGLLTKECQRWEDVKVNELYTTPANS